MTNALADAVELPRASGGIAGATGADFFDVADAPGVASWENDGGLAASGLGVAAPWVQDVSAQLRRIITAASARWVRVCDTDVPLRTIDLAPAVQLQQPTGPRA
jgi:hypothetical protein